MFSDPKCPKLPPKRAQNECYLAKIARLPRRFLYPKKMISFAKPLRRRRAFSTRTQRKFLTVSLLSGSIISAQCDPFHVRGFMDQISDLKVVPHSQPSKIKPLKESAIPKDVDLPLMAEWSMNY